MATHEPFDVLMPVYIGDDPDIAILSIETVLNNSLQPERFVIIKDGPVEDKLESYLDALENSHLNVFVCFSEINVGLGPILNQGLANCISDLVFRCDADDLNHPQRFALQLAEMSTNPCDVLGTQITEVDPETGIRRQKKVPVTELEVRKFSQYRNPVNHMSVLFKRSSVLAVGGYPSIRFKEDYALWLKLLSAGYAIRNSTHNLVNARAGETMVGRRRGFSSVKSELHLLWFRVFTCKDFTMTVLLISFGRTFVMMLPSSILKLLYTVIRK